MADIYEERLDPEELPVYRLAFELLADGPRSGTDLATHIRTGGGFAHIDDTELTDEDFVDYLLDILTIGDHFWVRDEQRIHRVDRMLDGVVLTHRLTADDIARGGVALEPDLGMIDFDFDLGAPVQIDGHEVDCNFDLSDPWHGWTLPSDLMGDAREGDLIAIRRRGTDLHFEHGPALDAAVEAADVAAVVADLDRILQTVADTGIGLEATELVMALLMDRPDAFREPLPPITELLDAAGAQRKGGYFGPADVDWEFPGAGYARMLAARRAEQWGFDDCCEDAFDTFQQAWFDHVMNQPARLDPAEVRRALAHNAVSLAALEEIEVTGADPAGVVEFLMPMIDTPRRDAAPVLYMIGDLVERNGAIAEAEAFYERARLTDPDFLPPTSALAAYAFERGDLARARSLLVGAEPGGGRHPIVELIDQVAVSTPSPVGRNEPCPCGSGRKYKQCHLGKPLDTAEATAKLLLHKALLHLYRRERETVDEIIEMVDPERREHLADNDLVLDIVLFEGGVFESFVDTRSDVLGPAELDEAREWLTTPRRLFEVTAVEPGKQLELRDVITGATRVVPEQSGSHDIDVGEYLLTRLVRPDTDPALVGTPSRVPMQTRDHLLEVLDAGSDPVALIEWYADATAPPSLRNRSGHDLVFCEVVIDPGEPDLARVEGGLDELFRRDDTGDEEDPRWTWLAPALDGIDEQLVMGTIALDLDHGHITVSVNSEERADAAIELLATEFGDLSVLDDHRTPFDEMPLPDDGPEAASGLIDPADAPPAVQQALRDHIRQHEDAWLDQSIPALDGLTPRQAADDPTRRDDLRRLLASFEPLDGGFGMDPDRIRALLGLD